MCPRFPHTQRRGCQNAYRCCDCQCPRYPHGDGVRLVVYVPSSSETTILELTDPELTYLGGFNTSSGRWMRPWQVLRNTRYVQNYWRELAKPLMRRVRIRVSVQGPYCGV